MTEFYDIFTNTTYQEFIRNNWEIRFLKEDTDYDGKWVKDFMGNQVLLLIREDTNEIYGLKSEAKSSPFLVLYLLAERGNALIGLVKDPILNHASSNNILDYANEFHNKYKDNTACFLAFVKDNDECQKWLQILPEF
ncbi:MAG TPA: hypothetical protein PKA44_11065 [Saprospiraceae bacterium]|jgi:hypothetical protein|nr:hypothetical protein [Saprospiraceae bacterium]